MKRSIPSLLALCLLAGCGGGGGSNLGSQTPPTAKVLPKVSVAWPERLRAVDAPSGADRAEFRLIGSLSSGKDIVFTGDRPAGAGANIQTYSSPSSVVPGPYRLELAFRTASSAAVAFASVDITVAADGTMKDSGGLPLGPVALTGKLERIVVDQNQTISLNDTKDLAFRALTANGSIVAVPYGALRTDIISGGDVMRVEADGALMGVKEGEASVVLVLDTLRSDPTTVRVIAPRLAVRTIDVSNDGMVFDPVGGKIYAVQSEAGSVVAIDPSTAAIGTPLPVGPSPHALALSDDGSMLYVGLDGNSTVRPVDLVTGVPKAPFHYPEADLKSGLDIAVQPGVSGTVAVFARFIGTVERLTLQVFDEGVPRPRILHFGAGGDLLWHASDRLYVAAGGIVRRYSVEAYGPVYQKSASDTGFPAGVRAVVEGRFYTNTGNVYDAETMLNVGGFRLSSDPQSIRSNFAGPIVDADSNRAYFVQKEGGDFHLRVFTQDTFAYVADRLLTGIRPSTTAFERREGGLFRCGAKGLAFRTRDQIVLIENVLGTDAAAP